MVIIKFAILSLFLDDFLSLERKIITISKGELPFYEVDLKKKLSVIPDVNSQSLKHISGLCYQPNQG